MESAQRFAWAVLGWVALIAIGCNDESDGDSTELAAPASTDDAGLGAPAAEVATPALDASVAGQAALDGGGVLLDANLASSDASAASGEAFQAVFELLTEHCVECHGPGKQLDVSTLELAHEQLVGVAAKYRACASDGGTPVHVRVAPGAPDMSLLIQKLENKQTCGGQMPRDMLLPAASIELFRAWVASGAPK